MPDYITCGPHSSQAPHKSRFILLASVAFEQPQFACDCANGRVRKIRDQMAQRRSLQRLAHVREEKNIARGPLDGAVQRRGFSTVRRHQEMDTAAGVLADERLGFVPGPVRHDDSFEQLRERLSRARISSRLAPNVAANIANRQDEADGGLMLVVFCSGLNCGNRRGWPPGGWDTRSECRRRWRCSE